LVVQLACGEGANTVELGAGNAAQRTVEVGQSTWDEFDIAPAAQDVRNALEPSRDSNGPLWSEYRNIMSSPIAVHLPMADHVPEQLKQIAQAQGMVGERRPVSEEMLQLSAQMGPEARLLVLMAAARQDYLIAVNDEAAGPQTTTGRLVAVAQRFADAAACGASEERRCAALLQEARVRERLGQQEAVQTLKAQIVSSPMLTEIRKRRWCDKDARRFVGLGN
jgi:hypothetical protein